MTTFYYDRLTLADPNAGIACTMINQWEGTMLGQRAQISSGRTSRGADSQLVVGCKFGPLDVVFDMGEFKEAYDAIFHRRELGRQDEQACLLIHDIVAKALRMMTPSAFAEVLLDTKHSYLHGVSAGIRHAKKELKLWLADDESSVDLKRNDDNVSGAG